MMKVKLTKEEAIKKHREMWNWIADETLKKKDVVYKSDYIVGFCDNANTPVRHCYCCDYALQELYENEGIHDESQRCTYCPIDWNSTQPQYQCMDKNHANDNCNLYSKWSDKTTRGMYANVDNLANLAREIANLPERKDVK